MLAVRAATERSGACFSPAPGNVCFPFMSATMVLGPVAHFLALLIKASLLGPDPYERRRRYWAMQALYVTSLAAAFGTALLLNVDALFSTAAVFGVLFAVEKAVELDLWRANKWATVGLALAFFILWRVAILLNSSPQHLVALLRHLNNMVGRAT